VVRDTVVRSRSSLDQGKAPSTSPPIGKQKPHLRLLPVVKPCSSRIPYYIFKNANNS